MKERISDAMMTFDKDKVTAGTFRFSFRKSTAVVVENEELLPEEYFRTERTICRKELLDALKAGELIAGAMLETRQTLQMR